MPRPTARIASAPEGEPLPDARAPQEDPFARTQGAEPGMATVGREMRLSGVEGEGDVQTGGHFHFRLRIGEDAFAFIFTAKDMKFSEIHLRVCSSRNIPDRDKKGWSLLLRQFCPQIASVVFSGVQLHG